MDNLYIVIKEDYVGWVDHRHKPQEVYETHISEEWIGFDFCKINEEIHTIIRDELDVHHRVSE